MIRRINDISNLLVACVAVLYGSLRLSMNKKCVALCSRLTIISGNNTPDASHENCAPLGVTYTRKTPPTHLVSSAHQAGYFFLGFRKAAFIT